jgi:hypothetical protein
MSLPFFISKPKDPLVPIREPEPNGTLFFPVRNFYFTSGWIFRLIVERAIRWPNLIVSLGGLSKHWLPGIHWYQFALSIRTDQTVLAGAFTDP